MNKKNIEWIIGISVGILTIISYSISIYKESKLIAILTTFALLIIVIVILWNKLNKVNKEKNTKEFSEKKKNNRVKKLEKELQKKENENKALKKEMCQECKKIYTYGFSDDEWISLSEKPNKDEYFTLIDEMSDKEGIVYYLDEYIFINFSLEKEGKESYLINLISGLIYLPVDEWKNSKVDDFIVYRQLCSNRKIHLNFSQLI